MAIVYLHKKKENGEVFYIGIGNNIGRAYSVKNRNNSAAGNSTRGIFALGLAQPPCCGVVSTTREKYTYASCSSTASGVGGASVASSDGSAASWATCVNT